MVQIDVIYEGGLRCRSTHGPSRTQLDTDAPVDNQGRGESFSPTDLVATALGTCMLTTMGIVAERKGWKLDGATMQVEKKMAADPKRRIGELEIVVHVPGAFDAAAQAELEETARTCPVALSLNDRLATPVRFEWGARQGSAV